MYWSDQDPSVLVGSGSVFGNISDPDPNNVGSVSGFYLQSDLGHVEPDPGVLVGFGSECFSRIRIRIEKIRIRIRFLSTVGSGSTGSTTPD